MSKYTAEQVAEAAHIEERLIHRQNAAMLRELERRLRQEEEENRRDVANRPRVGDVVKRKTHDLVVYTSHMWTIGDKKEWANLCAEEGATIIRRREVQQ